MATTETYDVDTAAFLAYMRPSNPSIKNWEIVSAGDNDNETSLADEMETTALNIEEFVIGLENQLKMRVFRRKNEGGDTTHKSVTSREQEFREGVNLGLEVMGMVWEVMKMEEPSSRSSMSISKESYFSEGGSVDSKRSVRSKIKILMAGLMVLVERFAKILDAEGLQHNFPRPSRSQLSGLSLVPSEQLKLSVSDKKLEAKPIKEEKKPSLAVHEKHHQSLARIKSRKRRDTEEGGYYEEELSSPGAFVREYAKRDQLMLEYKEIRVSRSIWSQEYVYICKLGSIAAEGNGHKRSIAKQDAAAHVMRVIIKKQKKGTLPEEMSPLSSEELELALRLTCETQNYEIELQEVCSSENARPPIFIPITNAIGNATRCKALGVNAIVTVSGKGRTKEIARRMAAKLVIDLVIDTRRKERLLRAKLL